MVPRRRLQRPGAPGRLLLLPLRRPPRHEGHPRGQVAHLRRSRRASQSGPRLRKTIRGLRCREGHGAWYCRTMHDPAQEPQPGCSRSVTCQALRHVVALDGATFGARPGRLVGLPRTERRRQDDDDALRLRPGRPRPRRDALEGQADRPGRPAALRLHAGAARPLPADEGRRPARATSPSITGCRAASPRRPPCAGSSGWASANGSIPSSRSCRTATSSGSSWRSRSSTTRSCSSSTSRSPASTRSGSGR